MNVEVRKYGPYNFEQVKTYLPHRAPFIFVDEILEIVPGQDDKGIAQPVGTKIVGKRTFPSTEYFFEGHFPSFPITPGVILVETMAQVGGFGFLPWIGEGNSMGNEGAVLKLAGVDRARFRKPVLPNDEVIVTTDIIKNRRDLWSMRARAEVQGAVVAQCEILAAYNLASATKQ